MEEHDWLDRRRIDTRAAQYAIREATTGMLVSEGVAKDVRQQLDVHPFFGPGTYVVVGYRNALGSERQESPGVGLFSDYGGRLYLADGRQPDQAPITGRA